MKKGTFAEMPAEAAQMEMEPLTNKPGYGNVNDYMRSARINT
jgi:hypothetical protein